MKTNNDVSPSKALAVIIAVLAPVELFWLYYNVETARIIANLLTIAIPVVAWKSIHAREIYLFGVSIALLVIAYAVNEDIIALAALATERAAFLAVFIALMAMLRQGAMTSQSILKVGNFLTHQKPGKRYASIFAGSHFLASIINLGALSLFAPIIQRGIRANQKPGQELSEINKIRERRQLTACLRGFSWFLVWAPTAVTQAVMPTLMSGINSWRLIVTGLGLATLMFAISWVDDTIRWKLRRAFGGSKSQPLTPKKAPVREIVNVATIGATLLIIGTILTKISDVSLITGVMIAAPVVVTVWIAIQNKNKKFDAKKRTIQQVRIITIKKVPMYVREIIFVASAGFIGTVAAHIIPVEQITDLVRLEQQPQWLILWSISVAVWALGQIGLSPVTMAVFFGTIIAQIDNFPTDITLAALAIATGSAICTNGAPFSSGVMMLARATGHTPFTISWKWNGSHTMITIIALLPIFVVLTKI